MTGQNKKSRWRTSFSLPKTWKKSLRVRFILYFIFGIIFALLLTEHVLTHQYDLAPGSVSRETIDAPITKLDKAATKEARDLAASSVPKQYRKDEQLTTDQIKQLNQIYTDIRQLLIDKSLSEEEKLTNLRSIISYEFPDMFYKKLVQIDVDELTEMRLVNRDIVRDILSSGVRPHELERKRDEVDQALVTSTLTSDGRYLVSQLAKNSIVANELYDQERTEALQEAARESVEPILIKKGEIIVSAGEVVTEEQYRKLKEMGLLKSGTSIWLFVGLGMLVTVLVAMLYFFINRFRPKIHQDNSKLLMVITVNLLTLGVMKVLAIGQNLEWSTIGYLAPVALGTMLITLLIDLEIALWCGVLLSIATGIFFNEGNHLLFDFRYGMVGLTSGTAAAFALSGARKRSAILQAGLVASVTSIIPIVAIYLLNTGDSRWIELVQSIGFGVASGLLCAVLTIGFLPYFETAFDILSPLRLLELSNPNHPLLRKLLIKTPGTYHHSIIVGNLSEAAAEAIGADGLLARVGAYYHDLGKTKRPQFFIENQMQAENPHDKLSPNLSKSIILSHPRDGVKMLEEYRIPKPIRDIASQHHGTTLLKYFYHKAKKQSDGTQVLEADYRYPGPKAQFKEAAIVGIADCVEAAVRSLARPTPERIESMVRKIIQDRLEDGQFNECHLTLKELDLIARSMCETLKGIFHSRIEYPDDTLGKGVKHA